MNIQVISEGKKYQVTDIKIDLDKGEIVYDLLGNNELRQVLPTEKSPVPKWVLNQKIVPAQQNSTGA